MARNQTKIPRLRGGVIAADAKHEATLKLKANTSAIAENTVSFSSVIFGWIKKY